MKVGALAVAAALAAAGVRASDTPQAQSVHWRAHVVRSKDGPLCTVEAAARGDRRFVVQVGQGGRNAWFFYEERVATSAAASSRRPLGKDDDLLLRLEGRRPVLHDYDVSLMLEAGDSGPALARIAMPGGYAPSFIRGMRANDWVTVLRAVPGTTEPEVLHRFPLRGFSSALGSLAARCRFEPTRLFQE